MIEENDAEIQDLNNQISNYYANEMKLKEEVKQLKTEKENNQT